MTIIGFIPGVDVISDAYFLGRALVDVAEGKVDRGDVPMTVSTAAKGSARGNERLGIPHE